MRCVLVTHADEPIGRRLVKLLCRDESVQRVHAVGSGRAPRSFERFVSAPGPRLVYWRLNLAKPRPASDLFHAPELRDPPIDSVVYLPRHGAPSASDPTPAGVSERTDEVRLVVKHCLESGSVRRLVALSSAFVYRLEPGNANRLTEDSPLDLDPEVPSEIRSWIDCDMILHGEVHSRKLCVTLLRAPTVVASGGYVFMNPSLAAMRAFRVRPMGFDPVCPLVADKDVARALRLSLRAERPGIFNIAADETLPLSVLCRWTGDPGLPVPGLLLRSAARAAGLLGRGGLAAALDRSRLHYGFALDTRRAERTLGFRPAYRIALSRAGDGTLRIETVRTS